MSRNFEILKKANRIQELFGPSPSDVVTALDEPTTSGEKHAGAGASFPDDPASGSAQEEAAEIPGLPVRPSTGAEDWRHLIEYFFSMQDSALCSSIGICSAKRGEPTGAFIAALGEYLNWHVDSPALVVEATFERPRLAEIFGVPAAPGLHEMLQKGDQIPSEWGYKSRFEHLWILPAGGKIDRPVLRDLEDSFDRVYRTLAARFRHLILELPPATDGHEFRLPYSLPDAVVLVVRPNSIGVRDVQRAVRRLTNAKANLVGTILDDLEPQSFTAGNGGWWSKARSIVSRLGMR